MKSLISAALIASSFLFETAAPASGLRQLPDDPVTLDSSLAEPVTRNSDQTLGATALKEPSTSPAEIAAVMAKYKYVDPRKMIAKSILTKAILYYDANLAIFANKNFLGVVDFSIKSNRRRWFVIEMKAGNVWAIHVAHGNKSDVDGDGIPETFSNVDGSSMSSLGVYRTAETYESSKFGHSLRVDGLSKTNSNVRSRAIVIHPAWYVWESDVIAPGRTAGCLGISKSVAPQLIDEIKNGSMVYVGLESNK